MPGPGSPIRICLEVLAIADERGAFGPTICLKVARTSSGNQRLNFCPTTGARENLQLLEAQEDAVSREEIPRFCPNARPPRPPSCRRTALVQPGRTASDGSDTGPWVDHPPRPSLRSASHRNRHPSSVRSCPSLRWTSMGPWSTKQLPPGLGRRSLWRPGTCPRSRSTRSVKLWRFGGRRASLVPSADARTRQLLGG